MRAEPGAVEELQRLVRLLEQSGLADRRPDARALLVASQRALQPEAEPPPRPAVRGQHAAPPSLGKAQEKARELLRRAADAAVLFSLIAWATGFPLLPEAWDAPGFAPLLAAASACALLRAEAVAELAYEAAFRLGYWGFGAYLWVAEAFSHGAARRYAERLAAADVMWAWRRHRRSLAARPTLPDLERFLADTYGPAAAVSFRRAVSAMVSPPPAREGGPLRGLAPVGPNPRMMARIERLRFSALIRLFEQVARGGAFWSAAPPPPEPAPPPEPVAEAAPVVAPAEDPAVIAARRRRADELRDKIKRKRQDVTTAYTWKMKTQAEVDQRERYVDGLKAEIAALEAELKELTAANAAAVTVRVGPLRGG
jgi:hypothetical protein